MEGHNYFLKGMGNSLEVTRCIAAMDKDPAWMGNSVLSVKKACTKTGTIKVEEISYDNYCAGIIAQAVLTYLKEKKIL